MKRVTLAGGLALSLSLPASAFAAQPSRTHLQAYQMAYRAARARFGAQAVGCDLIGRRGSCRGHATDAGIVQSLGVLGRMLAPVAPRMTRVVGRSVSLASTYIPTVQGASGVPACASESGTNYSTGPANTNPSSGATGRYQIVPSTATAFGCNLSTPGGQDVCAQRIYAHQGAGAWVGCGG